jgi:hypothetical protein
MSNDTALGWRSEAPAGTNGKTICPGARSTAWIGRSARREFLVERAVEHPVWRA